MVKRPFYRLLNCGLQINDLAWHCLNPNYNVDIPQPTIVIISFEGNGLSRGLHQYRLLALVEAEKQEKVHKYKLQSTAIKPLVQAASIYTSLLKIKREDHQGPPYHSMIKRLISFSNMSNGLSFASLITVLAKLFDNPRAGFELT